MRTVYAAAPADFDLFQFRAALRAGQPFPAVHQKEVFIIPHLPVRVLIITERGPVIAQSLGNHLIDALIQGMNLLQGQFVRVARRPDSRRRQCFIRINVAKACDYMLVQKEALYHPVTLFQLFFQICFRKFRRQRFRPQASISCILPGITPAAQAQRPKRTDIGKPQI